MLPEEVRLRDRILAHLQDTGSDSISGVARELSRGRSRPIHRLTTAGYLASMAEEGILRAVERPPSIHYTLALPVAARDVYQRIGQAVKEVPMPSHQRPLTALAALVQLLGRPVFRAELQHTRVAMPEELPMARAVDAERQIIRQQIAKRRWPALTIPTADPLLESPAEPGPVQEVLRRALLSMADADHLARLDKRGTQTSLMESR